MLSVWDREYRYTESSPDRPNSMDDNTKYHWLLESNKTNYIWYSQCKYNGFTLGMQGEAATSPHLTHRSTRGRSKNVTSIIQHTGNRRQCSAETGKTSHDKGCNVFSIDDYEALLEQNRILLTG